MSDVTGTFTASESFIGYGAEFQVGQADSPESFTSVPAVKSITFGDMTTGVVDITHLRSPARHREKLATIRDSGPITVRCGYDPTHGAHKQAGGDGFEAGQSVIALWQNVTENNFRIIFPAAAGSIELDIVGTVTKYQINELTTETETECELEITPLRDYSTGLP
jgi:hypothetical protein